MDDVPREGDGGPAGGRTGPAGGGSSLGDVLDHRVRLLLVGINPGRRSAERNRHFAGPGNRFWPALSASGLLARPFGPDDQHLLPAHGLGITNLVARPTSRAAEVTAAELHAGAARLRQLVADLGIPAVAVLGVDAYRTAFERPDATRGQQPDDPRWWLLDNPSGLNAHASVAGLADAFAAAGAAAGLPLPGA
ncbi:MAG: mismatch-specific DNA-glycosylase [Actinobacteria bacterium]|nr:mismatch-specific DNA-glycosylase [Actinomycetota bacterium]